MNQVFNNLTDSLSEEFKKFDLDEVVHLNLSKLAEYDLPVSYTHLTLPTICIV